MLFEEGLAAPAVSKKLVETCNPGTSPLKSALAASAAMLGILQLMSVSASAGDSIVWQNASGQVHYWSMSAGQRMGGIDIQTPVGEWRLAGVGDVDGDGTADIVWQHANGQVHYWPMRGGQRTGGIDIFTPVGGEWRLAGVGDIDGDGTADIIWQHANGLVHYWPMRGGLRTGGIDIHTPVGEWRLAGVGDINGNGTADILWQHANGLVHYWSMRGGQRTGGIDIQAPVGEWKLAGVGDVDGDGTADILWQHANGQVHYWPMRGGQRTGGIDIHTPVAKEWKLVGAGNIVSGRCAGVAGRYNGGSSTITVTAGNAVRVTMGPNRPAGTGSCNGNRLTVNFPDDRTIAGTFQGRTIAWDNQTNWTQDPAPNP